MSASDSSIQFAQFNFAHLRPPAQRSLIISRRGQHSSPGSARNTEASEVREIRGQYLRRARLSLGSEVSQGRKRSEAKISTSTTSNLGVTASITQIVTDDVFSDMETVNL